MMDDEAIRTLVTRLARPHPSGGRVIERASILAEGSESGVVIAWIVEHGGEPEAVAPKHGGGLAGMHSAGTAESQTPLRFVLPAGALV